VVFREFSWVAFSTDNCCALKMKDVLSTGICAAVSPLTSVDDRLPSCVEFRAAIAVVLIAAICVEASESNSVVDHPETIVDESEPICAADINETDIFYIPFGSAL